MAGCEYTIAGDDRVYSESEFKKLLSEGYLDKVMLENQVKVRGIKPNEELAKSFTMPSAIQPTVTTEVKEEVTPTAISGKEIAKEAVEMGSDQGGISDYTANRISNEDYVEETVSIEDILESDPDLQEYIDSGEIREFEGEPFKMNPIISSDGEVLDGYNRIAQMIENGESEVKVFRGVKPVTKTEEKVTEPTAEDEQIEKTAKELEGMDIESLFEKTNNKKYFRGQPTEELPQKDIFISPNEIVGKMYTKGKGILKKLTLKTSNLFDIDTKVTKELNDKLIESWKKNVPKDILIPKEIIKGEYIGGNYSQELKENEQFRRALEGIGYDGLLNNFTRLKLKSPKQEIIVFDKSNLSEINSNVISSAYHKAKQDGSNPELVKSVEELLGKKEPTTEVTPETKQPTKEETPFEINLASKIAEAIRKGKTEEGAIKSNILGPLWDNTFEAIAQVVEKGGIEAYRIRQSIQKGLNALKNNSAFKQFMDENPKEAKEVLDGYSQKLKEHIYQKHNVNPTEDFGNVWDDSVKIVKDNVAKSDKSPESLQKAIDEGFKNVKESAWYNSLGKEQRQQFASDYNEAMNRMFPIKEGKGKVSKETISKGEKEKGKEFKEKVSEATGTVKPEKKLSFSESELLRMQIKYGNVAGKETIKNLQDIKQQIKEYAEENLPKDSYSKTEVDRLMNSLSKATTEKGLESALDKIDSLVAKKLEKTRKETIKNIQDKVKRNSKKIISTNRRTGRRTAKISLDAQEQLNQLHKQGVFNNLDALSQEELNDINDNIDNILSQGKADKKFEKAIDDLRKRTDQAMILEELAGKPEILNGEEEILDKLTEESGVVVINNQSMNKSRFETFVENNPDADLSNVKFYPNEYSNVDQLKDKLQSSYKKAKATTLMALRDLETAVLNLQKGSAKMRNWLENSLMKPIREAEFNKQDFIHKINLEHNNKLKEIFGAFQVKGMNVVSLAPYTLNAYSTVSAGKTSLKSMKLDNLTNAQVIQFYGLITNQDASLTELSENKKANVELLKKYNKVDPQAIIDYMNDPKNKKLLDYYNYLAETYNGKFADEFIPMIEKLYGIVIEKGNYWPEPKSGAGTDVGSLLNLEGGNSSNISVIAPQMKPRTGGNHPFEVLSATEMFNRYMESMAHAKEFLPIVENVFSLLSKNNIPHIINKFGDINKYNSFIQDLNVVLTDKKPFTNDFTSAMSNANALTTLSFKPKSVIQQSSALFHYYHAGIKDGVYPHDILAAGLPINKNEVNFLKDFYSSDNSYLWTRLSGGMTTQDTQAVKTQIDALLEKALKQGTNINQVIKDFSKIIVNAGMSPIKLGDFMSSSFPMAGMNFALAQFRKNQSRGNDFDSSKRQAMQRWFEETERTQQPSIAREVISSITYNPSYRVFFPFSSANNAMMKKVHKGLLNLSDWKNLNDKEKVQSATDVLYYSLFAGLPFALISSGGLLAWARLNDEEDENLAEAQKKRIVFDAFAESIQSNIGTLGLVGTVLKSYINTQRGKEFYNNIPLFERLMAYNDLIVSLSNTEGDVSKLSESEWNAFLKGYEPTEFEMRKIKKMTPDEAEKYFQENPFARKVFYGDLAKEYSELNTIQKMDYKGKRALDKIVGTKNMKEFADGVGALIQGNAKLEEILFGVKTMEKEGEKFDPYFRGRKEDQVYKSTVKLYNELMGEETLPEEEELGEKEKKEKEPRSSAPGQFKGPNFKPKLPKF